MHNKKKLKGKESLFKMTKKVEQNKVEIKALKEELRSKIVENRNETKEIKNTLKLVQKENLNLIVQTET